MKRLGRLAALVGAAALATAACDRLASPDVRQAREQVDPFAAFIRPVTGGYEVVSSSGAVRDTVSKGDRRFVSSYTPDFSGYSFVTGIDGGSGPVLFRRMVRLAGLEPAVVASAEVDIDAGESFDHRLRWSSADGSSLVVSIAGDLWRVSRCGADLRRDKIAEGAGSFAVSERRVYYLPVDRGGSLRWIGVGEDPTDPPGSIEVATGFDDLEIGENDRHLLLWKRAAHRPELKTGFVVADVDSGSIRPLDLPVQGEVFEVLPLRGTRRAVLELWSDGRERIDGTELTRFVLWDYGAGTVVPFLDNERGLQLHALPANVSEVPPTCPQPTP